MSRYITDVTPRAEELMTDIADQLNVIGNKLEVLALYESKGVLLANQNPKEVASELEEYLSKGRMALLKAVEVLEGTLSGVERQ